MPGPVADGCTCSTTRNTGSVSLRPGAAASASHGFVSPGQGEFSSCESTRPCSPHPFHSWRETKGEGGIPGPDTAVIDVPSPLPHPPAAFGRSGEQGRRRMAPARSLWMQRGAARRHCWAKWQPLAHSVLNSSAKWAHAWVSSCSSCCLKARWVGRAEPEPGEPQSVGAGACGGEQGVTREKGLGCSALPQPEQRGAVRLS